VCVDARTAAPKPASVDHIHAAALPLVTLTAWEALLLRARIEQGETVLIHAGGGGVGHIAIQLAKLQGCRVLTTASRDESIDLCRRLGADVVIDYSKEDFVQRVQQETHGGGCPVVFDTVGSQTFDRSLDCVAVNGRLITAVGTPSAEIAQKLFRKNATLHFEFMGAPTVYGVRPESQGEILEAAARLVDKGELKPHVSRVIHLEELAEGHRLQESGHVTGKIVVLVKRVKPVGFILRSLRLAMLLIFRSHSRGESDSIKTVQRVGAARCRHCCEQGFASRTGTFKFG